MLILSRVCAEFRDRTGAVIYRVTPDTRLTFREAPEAIREDPLFDMLVNEGALEAAVTAAHRRRLESDPLDGADAAGRKETAPRQKAPARKRAAAEKTAPPEGGAETDA